jgi:hypothetical protein
MLCACSSAQAAGGDKLDVGNAMLRSAASTEKDVSVVAAAPSSLGSGKRQGLVAATTIRTA